MPQGAGMFSKLGGYVKGAHGALGSGGTGLRTAMYGAAAGAGASTLSDDTGLMAGAAAGAGLAYGGRLARGAARAGGNYMRGAGGAVSYAGLGMNLRAGAGRRAMRDMRVTASRARQAGSMMMANEPLNRVTSTLSRADRFSRGARGRAGPMRASGLY